LRADCNAYALSLPQSKKIAAHVLLRLSGLKHVRRPELSSANIL
jgi:hypothetical protein